MAIGFKNLSWITYGERKVSSANESISIRNLRIPFKIQISIHPQVEYEYLLSRYYPKNMAGLKFVLERDSLSLLLGSFYFPTGVFALLSVGSYIINPEIVSVNCISNDTFVDLYLF